MMKKKVTPDVCERTTYRGRIMFIFEILFRKLLGNIQTKFNNRTKYMNKRLVKA
jgi:hypothetical protein